MASDLTTLADEPASLAEVLTTRHRTGPHVPFLGRVGSNDASLALEHKTDQKRADWEQLAGRLGTITSPFCLRVAAKSGKLYSTTADTAINYRDEHTVAFGSCFHAGG